MTTEFELSCLSLKNTFVQALGCYTWRYRETTAADVLRISTECRLQICTYVLIEMAAPPAGNHIATVDISLAESGAAMPPVGFSSVNCANTLRRNMAGARSCPGARSGPRCARRPGIPRRACSAKSQDASTPFRLDFSCIQRPGAGEEAAAHSPPTGALCAARRAFLVRKFDSATLIDRYRRRRS